MSHLSNLGNLTFLPSQKQLNVLNNNHHNLPSNEQKNIIDISSQNKNIIVKANPGSGKTTTCAYLAQSLPRDNILLVTFGRRLTDSTNERLYQLKIQNMKACTYHSFCNAFYKTNVTNDLEMEKVIENKTSIDSSALKIPFDLIIIDEIQDMTSLYFQLIWKFTRDHNQLFQKSPRLCLLGDAHQCIYSYKQADSRYLTLGNYFFQCFNTYSWETLPLSISFRLSTEVCDFINHCMLGKNLLFSNKTTGIIPTYIRCIGGEYEIFNQCDKNGMIFRQLEHALYHQKYAPEDIFILSPSIKSNMTPCKKLVNTFKEQHPEIDFYVPISDEETVDEKYTKGKISVCTYHQSKGLERKVVLILGFDNSYFKYYNINTNPNICPNEIYVPTTRSLESLIMIENSHCGPLPFLKTQYLERYCQIIENQTLFDVEPIETCNTSTTSTTSTITSITTKKNKNPIRKAVETFISHLPMDIIKDCLQHIQIKELQSPTTTIDLPFEIIKKNGTVESVSNINGIIIPIWFEYSKTGRISILDSMIKEKKLYQHLTFLTKLKNKIQHQHPVNLEEVLKLSNIWDAFRSGYHHKMSQITKYDWINTTHIAPCMDRLDKLIQDNMSNDSNDFNNSNGFNNSNTTSPPLLFEHRVEYNDLNSDSNIILTGSIDMICGDHIYELKCTKSIGLNHFIQLALYMYLYEKKMNQPTLINRNNNHNNTTNNRRYYIYNILTDQKYEITSTLENLTGLVQVIQQHKNSPLSSISDQEMLQNCQFICQN